MATLPAAPLQIQPSTIRPIESRSNRETATKKNDFGSEFKRELNRDRSEKSAPDKSTAPTQVTAPKAEKAANNDAAAPTEQAQANAATLDPWLAMMQGAVGVVPTLTPATQEPQVLEAKDLSDNVDQSLIAGQMVFNTNKSTYSGSGSSLIHTEEATVKNNANYVNSILAAADDAASIAVDTAKLTPAALDFKADDVALINELKPQLPAPTDSRQQGTGINAIAAQNSKVETPIHHIATPIGESRWGDALAQRVGLMLGRQEQRIEMQLNPPNLGPLEVRLNLAQDQASVMFSTQNAAVREALAAAMPRLTALLADQGFTLSNVQVASDSLQQHQQQQNQQQSTAGSQQQNSGRELGATYANALGAETGKMQELGPLRLPVAKGGVSLFV